MQLRVCCIETSWTLSLSWRSPVWTTRNHEKLPAKCQVPETRSKHAYLPDILIRVTWSAVEVSFRNLRFMETESTSVQRSFPCRVFEKLVNVESKSSVVASSIQSLLWTRWSYKSIHLPSLFPICLRSTLMRFFLCPLILLNWPTTGSAVIRPDVQCR